MREQVVSSSEVTVTFIPCDNPECSNCQKKLETREYLDQRLVEYGRNAMHTALPPITLVIDPGDRRKLVYDGNQRVSHAATHGYPLRAVCIETAEDFADFVAHNDLLWFRIRDWDKLLCFMRVYAQYPRDNELMPSELRRMIDDQYWADQRQQEFDMFGPDDDD